MKSKTTNLVIMISVIVTALVLTVAGYIILPETLLMQITFSGERGTTMPKAIGLAIPLAFSSVFSVLYYKSNNIKHLVVSMVGILALVLAFIFNL